MPSAGKVKRKLSFLPPDQKCWQHSSKEITTRMLGRKFWKWLIGSWANFTGDAKNWFLTKLRLLSFGAKKWKLVEYCIWSVNTIKLWIKAYKARKLQKNYRLCQPSIYFHYESKKIRNWILAHPSFFERMCQFIY